MKSLPLPWLFVAFAYPIFAAQKTPATLAKCAALVELRGTSFYSTRIDPNYAQSVISRRKGLGGGYPLPHATSWIAPGTMVPHSLRAFGIPSVDQWCLAEHFGTNEQITAIDGGWKVPVILPPGVKLKNDLGRLLAVPSALMRVAPKSKRKRLELLTEIANQLVAQLREPAIEEFAFGMLGRRSQAEKLFRPVTSVAELLDWAENHMNSHSYQSFVERIFHGSQAGVLRMAGRTTHFELTNVPAKITLENKDGIRITVQANFDYEAQFGFHGAVGIGNVRLNAKSKPVAIVAADGDFELEPAIVKAAAEKLAFALEEISAEK